ncbi:HpcH/HpaI aldolase/citrate lyase family protein [Cupriavidus alkaliphilus]|uniref:HpcH/HpaI aldolase/citrate lyase family protein n=1 Tax=Cupriavidus alkaliphilus TaxID=942866 RepID=UPI00160E1E90|nr:CoA ester lyase [Cupriavidus alkaliphilus]MBB3014058.1 citrate lyase subunit beta/citryl-CoA lyase [Cupriavidus alkaliphilus]
MSTMPQPLRSLLFVPADSQRKLLASLRSGADGLVFDLEDAVPDYGKAAARQRLVAFLAEHRLAMDAAVLVRVNGLASGQILKDLSAVLPHRPHAIVLPKCRGVDDVHRLCDFLAAFECALLDGTWETGIIAMATESSEGVFGLSSYRNAPMRLRALMWGVEDLAADLGAFSPHAGRELTSPFSVARTMCLLAAAQAGIDAIDAVSTSLADTDQIRTEAAQARRDGFTAKAAAHPSHVDAINHAFLPQEDEVRWAREVVAAFSQVDASGVVRLGNAMIDRPHLRLAHRILCQTEGEG